MESVWCLRCLCCARLSSDVSMLCLSGVYFVSSVLMSDVSVWQHLCYLCCLSGVCGVYVVSDVCFVYIRVIQYLNC